MAKSKFFRVFTEGDSTDGRVIERKWIEDIVKTYNQTTYSARVWLEHFRSLLPDSPFRAYGDVIAVKAEEIDLPGIGKRLALFAQIDPTPDLVAMNKQRQKMFTSAEIDPDFAKTGMCYLTGLAVTDSPASLGTEMLAFSASATANPLAARKQSPDNLFTAALEFTLEIEADTESDAAKPSLIEQIKALFTKQKSEQRADFTEHAEAIELIAKEVKAQQDDFTAKLGEASTQFAELKSAHDKLAQDFATLRQQLASEDAGTTRPAATGGDGFVRTDC